MRRSISRVIFTFTPFLFINSCLNAPKEKVDSDSHQLVVSTEKINFAKEELRTEIDNYRFAIMDKLLTNEYNIMKYKETIVNKKAAIRRVYEVRIQRLEDTNMKLKNKISAYDAVDKPSWVNFKSEIDKGIQSLANDIDLLQIK